MSTIDAVEDPETVAHPHGIHELPDQLESSRNTGMRVPSIAKLVNISILPGREFSHDSL